MTSKDDDTLPLPGFSQELSIDVTVDEDFIPTSQPHSSGSSKMSKNSETNFNKSTEELKPSYLISDFRIDDTLPPETVADRLTLNTNKSFDFIPETEIKKNEMKYTNEEMSCKKKLLIFETKDISEVQRNQSWDEDVSKIPDTQNLSILEDSLTNIFSSNKKCEECITEIIVNDSAETVDLEVTPMETKKSENDRNVEISYSSSLGVERHEETQIFDNSSLLLLHNQDCSDSDKTESVNGITSQKLYLQATLDDEESNSKEKRNVFSRPFDVTESKNDEEKTVKVPFQNFFPKPKVQPKTNFSEFKTNISTRKLKFKLLVTCLVTVDTKTNKVTNKSVTEVQEISKPKPKHLIMEPASGSTSDKSKRQSTSSSGSVYSDKIGPFAIHKRISIKSDQTDSSEEDFTTIPRKEKMNFERVPWGHEYLVPLKLDDLLTVAIEDQEFLQRPDISSHKTERLHYKGLQENLESSSSEQTFCNLDLEESQCVKAILEESSNEMVENSELLLVEENQNLEENQEKASQEGGSKDQMTEIPQHLKTKKPETIETELKKDTPINFCDGLPVLARWSDKRYYSGVLFGNLKNDRWGVKFDDGASKLVREDFIMPTEWLKVGALVFAMTGDNYVSGQIVEVKKGKEFSYVVELDTVKKRASVKIADICLTDVMAGIIREKYKPLTETPRGKADINFDNVVSGKRLRDQRTPLKLSAPTQAGSSSAKKKSLSKVKENDSSILRSTKETTQNDDSEKKITGLKSENGHLVEDKVISADSQSGTETGETPFRSSKGPRKNAKPRSLSYETESSQRKKSKCWLAADGTPIPGPSGVTAKKKHKAKAETESPTEMSGKSSKKDPTEKGRKKRKLDESVENNVRKKFSKKAE